MSIHDENNQEPVTDDVQQAETVEVQDKQDTQENLSNEDQQSPEDFYMAEVARLKDQMLREQADMQNLRKRLQRDVEQARKFALEKFVGDLLPVLDNLERAIQAAGDDEIIKPFKEGVELTSKQFLDVLSKYNVQQLNPIGEPFDPQYHEAVTMVPNPSMEPNSVMDVMQKGYILNDRLLRAAMVVVTREP